MPRYRVKVDMDLCQGHAVCMSEAPEVFFVDEERDMYPKVQVLQSTVGEDLRDKVMNAAKYCPNRVIRIEELPD
jgi:ferredoxin